MKKIFATISLALALAGGFSASAQVTNSAYFTEGLALRHELNPAFIPEVGYFAIPAIGGLSADVSLGAGVGTFLYPQSDGSLTTFMSSKVSYADFERNLPENIEIREDLKVNVLSFGFKGFGGYNSFGISLREDLSANVPGELFRFIKYGMASESGSSYTINNLNASANAFVELAIGHSHRIGDHLTIGVKLKYLMDAASINMNIEELNVSASQDVWQINANNAQMKVAAPWLVLNKTDEGNIDFNNLGYDFSEFNIAGHGFAVDLGASYQLNGFELSASVLDLGMIICPEAVLATMSQDFYFDGFQDIDIQGGSASTTEDDNSISSQLDRLGEDLNGFLAFKEEDTESVNYQLAATVNLAAKYRFPESALSLGLLSSTKVYSTALSEEIRAFANLTGKWIDFSVNAAYLNSGFTAGFLLNLHPRGTTIFFGVDAPLTNYSLPYMIPINPSSAVVSFGWFGTFGHQKKAKDTI